MLDDMSLASDDFIQWLMKLRLQILYLLHTIYLTWNICPSFEPLKYPMIILLILVWSWFVCFLFFHFISFTSLFLFCIQTGYSLSLPTMPAQEKQQLNRSEPSFSCFFMPVIDWNKKTYISLHILNLCQVFF